MMRLIDSIQETLTSPQTALPATAGVQVVNWMGYVPDIVNITTVIYLVLLIVHKGWQMYKEWKKDKNE